MAEEKRGGRRVPNKPASYSGVGKNSRRTDGQPIRSPNVQDAEDLNVGDRAIIEQGQRIAPLSSTSTGPRMTPRPPAPALGPSGMEQMPQFLADMPSTRPMEDEMTPAEQVPDPDDDREFVLTMLASAPWGNDKVRQMLNDLRTERAQQTAPSPRPSPIVPAAPEAPIAEDPMEPEPVELGADTAQPLPEEDVEEEFI